ncbi:TPA: hypothetical protein L5R11_006538 [Pseudomonas aeruginosa]|nr:hypothetical protein [Pseudomonas aeruginosa]HBP0656758.1 hypothetical protein [Pseudomonas aeruginosa]HBP1001861.1 hypothetical protein [Pseudomonas aeruginosa]HBP1032499.1 hypothetical protein [Pseudomonas aeruginosa]HBP1413568.1 hypothetical protein [Pseudomonas aeruginosa]
MTDKQNSKDDDDDFDFSEINDFDFGDEVAAVAEQDIKAANNLRENVIKKQNTINEKEVERRIIALRQYEDFQVYLDGIHEPYSLFSANEVLDHLAYKGFLNSKTFWSFALIDGKRTKIEQIQYYSWAALEISKSTIHEKLKLLIIEVINSYIGELVFGKVAWKISLSL